MISDYLKKYSTYYLSQYSVTKKKFEDILKKKITKDFLEKKITITEFNNLILKVPETIEYYDEIGTFNEKRLIEITFQNFVDKGYSKKKIKYKILNYKFQKSLITSYLNSKLNDIDLEQLLIRNYLKKTKLVEKQKKLNISEKQLFDKIIKKLANQGFGYEQSKRILNNIIFDGNFN